MMKQFRLLRSNKQSGPYSVDELIQMGLKAYDLVWEEGRSAAWRYPSEIGELKAFAPAVEQQPFDRFYKRNEEKTMAFTNTIEPPLKKEKPRIRIKADCKKIEEPAVAIASAKMHQPQLLHQSIHAVQQPSWHDAWLDWEQEKKAAKYPGVANHTFIQKNEVPLETKFSQPLDDIKDRYVENILKTREKKSFAAAAIFQKKNLVAALLIGLICWGMYAGFVMKDPDAKNTAAAAKGSPAKALPTVTVPRDIADNTDAASQPVNNDDVKNTIIPGNNTVNANKNNLPKHAAENFQKTNQKPVSSIKNIAATSKQPSQPAAVLPPAEHSAVVKQSNGQYTRTVARRADNSSPANMQPSTVSATIANYAAPVSAKKTIDDFVTVSNMSSPSNSVQDVHLSVQNITGSPIDLAVVDIQYFDANGRFQKGETVYVNNIPSNGNVDVKVPDSRGSNHINYKVSLISAGQKTLVAE